MAGQAQLAGFAALLVPVLAGCGGHHGVNLEAAVSADFPYDSGGDYSSGGGSYSSSSSSSSSSSGSGYVTGSYVDSKGNVNDIAGTVDENGFLAATVINTATGEVTSGVGTADPDGSFSITTDDGDGGSGDLEAGD